MIKGLFFDKNKKNKGKAAFKIFMALAAVFLLGPAVYAGPLPEFRDFPALGFCKGSGVRLREEPDTQSEILGRLDEFDRVVVLGQTSVEGKTWLEVEHPEKAGAAWVFGDYLLPVDEDDGPLARMLVNLNQTFGITPEKARVLFGQPLKIESHKSEDKNRPFEKTRVFYPDHEAEYLNGNLVFADVKKGALPFGEIHIGDSTGRLSELLGDPALRGEAAWRYPMEDRTYLIFEIKNGQITRMTYQVYHDL